jgi:hypothetical protein
MTTQTTPTVVLRLTGTYGFKTLPNSLGLIEVFDTGSVRWTVRGADGGARPLVDITLAPEVFENATIERGGKIIVGEHLALTVGSTERAEKLITAVRSRTS